MRERLRRTLNREVTMPRWAIGLDFVYRLFLLGGAALVIVLWYQAATRDEEADRNARIQSCASGYAATYDAHLGLILEEATSTDGSDDEVLAGEGSALAELAKRRIGLAVYAASSVIDGNDFECPPLPERLMVEPIEP